MGRVTDLLREAQWADRHHPRWYNRIKILKECVLQTTRTSDEDRFHCRALSAITSFRQLQPPAYLYQQEK
jgi:hypothetical protein